VVLAGALDGLLKAFDAGTGRLLWASPLLGPISSGPAVVDDMVVVGSGTSSSDLCAKGQPYSDACFLAFDTVLGQQGGVHAFRLVDGPNPG
jgi:outer membrane protein assembly factor BamB